MILFRKMPAVVLTALLVFSTFLSISTPEISAQDTNTNNQDSKVALQRGYRTGYSDGYMAGYRDSIESSARSFERHREYTRADRAFNKTYGNLEDYRDGYQQGFESGYNTGFDKNSFDAAIPADLRKRGTMTPIADEPAKKPATTPASGKTSKAPTIAKKGDKPAPAPDPIPSGEPIILIPTDTELIVELLGDINTNTAKEGDRFQAKVVSPYEITGALIEGRVTKVQKPGRIKRRATLQFSFDIIRLSETRWSNFNASLMEIVAVKDDNVKKVDNEGLVTGKSTVKRDTITVGGAAGTGAVVGAVVGGPVGAAVGAGVGAAFGVGAIVVEKGKHIKLTSGQQIKIKTVYETQIR